jgi:hypothetical protein
MGREIFGDGITFEYGNRGNGSGAYYFTAQKAA